MERKKNWVFVSDIYPAGHIATHGPKTLAIRRDWMGITRSECMRRALRSIRRGLAQSPAHNPRVGVAMINGRFAASGPWRTLIRLKDAFRCRDDFRGVKDPRACFVVGYGPTPWKRLTGQ